MSESVNRWWIKNRSRPVVEPAKYAILLLVLLGSLLSALIALGVLPLNTSTDSDKVLGPYFLGSEGVVITGRDAVKLRSSGGEVVIDISAGSVSSPARLRYRRIIPSRIIPSELPSLPQGYVSTGRFFELTAEPERAEGGPVKFHQMLSITVVIEPNDLKLAGNDYSRFALQHFLEEQRSWVVLETTANPLTSTVVAQVDGLSLFALTVRLDPEANASPNLVPEDAPAATETPFPVPTTDPFPTATIVLDSSLTLPATATPIPVPTATATPTPTSTPTPKTSPRSAHRTSPPCSAAWTTLVSTTTSTSSSSRPATRSTSMRPAS